MRLDRCETQHEAAGAVVQQVAAAAEQAVTAGQAADGIAPAPPNSVPLPAVPADAVERVAVKPSLASKPVSPTTSTVMVWLQLTHPDRGRYRPLQMVIDDASLSHTDRRQAGSG